MSDGGFVSTFLHSVVSSLDARPAFPIAVARATLSPGSQWVAAGHGGEGGRRSAASLVILKRKPGGHEVTFSNNRIHPDHLMAADVGRHVTSRLCRGSFSGEFSHSG